MISATSPDGIGLVSSSADKSLCIWNMQRGPLKRVNFLQSLLPSWQSTVISAYDVNLPVVVSTIGTELLQSINHAYLISRECNRTHGYEIIRVLFHPRSILTHPTSQRPRDGVHTPSRVSLSTYRGTRLDSYCLQDRFAWYLQNSAIPSLGKWIKVNIQFTIQRKNASVSHIRQVTI